MFRRPTRAALVVAGNGAEVDLNIVPPAGGQPSADGTPPGRATLTFDLVDPWLRQAPVSVEVARTDAGSRGVPSPRR